MKFKVFLVVVLLSVVIGFGSTAWMLFGEATKHHDGSEGVVAAASLYVAVYALVICERFVTGWLKSS